MTEAQIKHMVDRFLGWKLPANFAPDGGVSFEPISNKGTAYERQREPTGTNLLDATQATEMVRHMLNGLPADGLIDRLENLRSRLATRREAFEVIRDEEKAAILSDCILLIAEAIRPEA